MRFNLSNPTGKHSFVRKIPSARMKAISAQRAYEEEIKRQDKIIWRLSHPAEAAFEDFLNEAIADACCALARTFGQDMYANRGPGTEPVLGLAAWINQPE